MAGTDGDELDRELADVVFDARFVRNAEAAEATAAQRAAAAEAARRPTSARAPAAKPSPARRPDRRQVLTIAGALVALVVVVAVMATLKSQGVGQGEAPAQTTAEAGLYGPGDCITWPETEAAFATIAGTEVVDCADPHRVEITGSVRLDDETQYPDDARFQVLMDQHCAAAPDGFQGWALHPSIDGWRAGDRALWCGFVKPPLGPGGLPPTFTS